MTSERLGRCHDACRRWATSPQAAADFCVVRHEPVKTCFIVTDVELPSTAGPVTDSTVATRHGRPPPLRFGAMVAIVLALVTGITMPVILSSRPAAADPVTDLQAQAAQLAHQILKQQLEIGGLQQQYGQATQQVQTITSAIATTRAAVRNDQHKIKEDIKHLRTAALFAYMTSDTSAGNSSSAVFSSNERTAQVRNVYQNLVAGNVNVALDQLHTDQANLRHRQQDLQLQQHQAESAQRHAADLVQQSQQVTNQLQSEQSQVKGRLAAAIAQQQAARAAAATAAIWVAQQAAAAQAAAAQRAQVQQAAQSAAPQPSAPAVSPAPSQTSSPPPQSPAPTPAVVAPASSGGSVPALNSFLQCVVQHESGGNYSVVSPSGQYFGAFQFSQSTWNYAAQLAGMPNLIGVAPNTASVAQQNALAIALYSADGSSPWYDPCTTG